ncbi:MAG: SDR family oxidoreductase [Weeksellaceae bacterium]
MASKEKHRPEQSQELPGSEKAMSPIPESEPKSYPHGKLHDKIAIITGADSGIGKATALLFAKEGAKVVVQYLSEDKDAKDTEARIKEMGAHCMLIKKDLSKEENCIELIDQVVEEYQRIDVLVNNAGMQVEQNNIEDITTAQLMETFHTNFFSQFWLSKYAVPHMPKGSSIVNTTSVTAYRGSDHLIDYASTKGAILSFTRSLANNFAKNKKGIRVNGVAPGPIWTPLIAASFMPEEIAKFGSDSPLGRAGQPNEVAPCYLFLASEDSSYMNGQILHPNGGEIVGS